MPIHILPADLAAKIAAGEVIERPASVVKELIENSIDAGATEIRVEIMGGGQRLIRVADNGCGIPAEQVPIAFAHHATSKLDTVDDLFRIQTLGFRGEALPSIAAVARVTLVTRARDEHAGSEIRVDGGEILDQHPQGAPAGTVVTVEDLFRHVPARLKFLKTPTTEAGHIADLIGAFALGYPHLRLSFTNESRLVFQSPGTGKMSDVLVKLLGVEVAQQMLELRPPSADGEHPAEPQVAGLVSPPSVNRATRKNMIFFLNHRWIQDRSLGHAILEAYRTALMVGRFPVVALDITVPAEMVDVNVHPTKSEVRFRDPGAVFSAVQRSVRAVLAAHAPIPTIAFGAAPAPRTWAPGYPSVSPRDAQLAIDLQRPAGAQGTQAPVAVLSPDRLPMLRVLGQIASTYIIAEGPDGLYLIDQHSAHERVLYEQLNAERVGAKVATQQLLDPQSLQLTPAQLGTFLANNAALESVGFRIEPFGNQTLLLRAVPAVMSQRDPRETVLAILDELEQGELPLDKSADARLISSVCKSIAVKGGQVLSLEEMRELVRRLEQTTAPRTCPHGRPTVIQLNVAQLEREFGRK